MPVIAVPGIVAALLAIMALLILWGVKAFGQGVSNFIPKGLPLIGNSLHNAVLAIVATAEAGIQWIMADFIRPVIHWILAPVYRLWDFIDASYALARTVAASWSWLLNSAIPSVIRKLEGYAHGLYSASLAYAHRLYVAAESYAHGLYSASLAYAHRLYVAAEGYAHRLYVAAEGYAHRLYVAAEAYAHAGDAAVGSYAKSLVGAATSALEGEIAKVRAMVSSELTTAEHYADTKIGTAVAGVHDSISTAVAGVIQTVDVDSVAGLAHAWPGLIEDVITLEGVIATDLPDIGAAVRAIPRAVPTDLTKALAIVGSVSIPMLRYMARCGIPNCRNLSQIGRDLQGLFNVLEGAGFLALIGYMVSDPTGAAEEARNTLEPLASGLVDAARGLIGV